jgi:hypothetical protein
MGSHARRHEHDERAQRVEFDHSKEPEVEAAQADPDHRDVASHANLLSVPVDTLPGVTVVLGPETPHLTYDDINPDFGDDPDGPGPIVPMGDADMTGQGGIEHAA